MENKLTLDSKTFTHAIKKMIEHNNATLLECANAIRNAHDEARHDLTRISHTGGRRTAEGVGIRG